MEFAKAFHREHEVLFGYNNLEMPIDLLHIRLSAIGHTPKDRVTRPALSPPVPSR